MELVRIIALAILTTFTALGSANAQQSQNPVNRPQRPSVIINDPSIYRPPPMPPERPYVQPAPTVVPPMERIPPVAPLSQPPIR